MIRDLDASTQQSHPHEVEARSGSGGSPVEVAV